jgi:NAD(P)-dependent dehydrogenase (short-subunit alcohol dehydrogenase family)
MIMSKVGFITGATRGVGAGIAKAALATGDNVVAAGWNTTAVTKALVSTENLLAITPDMTRANQIKAAVTAAVERFDRGKA